MAEFDRGPSVAFAGFLDRVPDPSVPDDFWFDWGPVFYRGRLDGSARVLCVASDPGPTERIAGRSLVGNAGQRVQGLLAKLGLTRSYVCLNAWSYAVHPSRAQDEEQRLDEPAELAWRNELNDRATGAKLEAVIAFGGMAQRAVGLWSSRPDVPVSEVPHPSSRDETRLLDEWRAAVSELRPIVTPDADGDNGGPNYGTKFVEGDYEAIPRRDLPFGAPAFLGDDAWVRAKPGGAQNSVSRPSPDDGHTLTWRAPGHESPGDGAAARPAASGSQLMALVLRGAVVTFDATHRVLDPGAAYVGDDGRLAAVASASDPAPAGFAGARQIDTGAVIYPGLIDLHNHIAYNTLPLWEAPGVPYQHHKSWTREDDVPDYGSSVTWPSRVLGQAAAEALIKYVEVKALVGGTTAIQGAPHVTRPVDGWLIRIVDVEKLPAGKDVVMAAVIQKEVLDLQSDAAKLDGTRVYIYHLAEGVPGSIVHKEFDNLGTALCLKPGLIGVHATALSGADFQAWQDAVTAIDPAERATVVWSPFSNLFLYHRTTDVLEADARGLRIALGADWAPSGTKHVLGELKVADAVNRESLGGHFSDHQLCDMVTANPGDALATAWGPQIGRLQPANAADLVVVERHDPDPYRNLIEATERHVRLVLVRGRPFYGTPALMSAAGATDSNPITVAGVKRRVCVRQPGVDAQLDWRGVRRALEKVRDDPQTAWQDAQHALASWAGALGDPDAPLVVFGDMPEGDLDVMAGSGEIPLDLQIPRLDSLTHDAAFFTAVARSGPPELQHLAAYYQ